MEIKKITEAVKCSNIYFLCSDLSFHVDQCILNKLTNRMLTH